MEIIQGVPEISIATQIAARGFVHNVSSALQKDVEGHLKDHLVFRVIEEEKDVGFGAFKILQTKGASILYVAGIIIDPVCQQKGVFADVIKAARMLHPSVRGLALRTQSCPCWAAGRKLCKEWFPPWHNLDVPQHLQLWGEAIARFLGPGNEFPGRCEGFYGAPLYGKKPIYHNEKEQRLFDNLCNFERGDAVICVGSLKEMK